MNPNGEWGFTIVDHLLARALVECYLDRDYSETIQRARDLARLAEKIKSGAYEPCPAGGTMALLNDSARVQSSTPQKRTWGI